MAHENINLRRQMVGKVLSASKIGIVIDLKMAVPRLQELLDARRSLPY